MIYASFAGPTFPLVFSLKHEVLAKQREHQGTITLPRIDNDLKVVVSPVGLLHIAIINPLGPGDIRKMLEHDDVLALYVGLSVFLLLALLLLVPEDVVEAGGGETLST